MGDTHIVKLFACIPPPLYGGVTVYSKRLALNLCRCGYPSGAFYTQDLVGVPKDYSYLFDRMVRHARSFYVLPEIRYLYNVCKPYKIIHTHLNLQTIFCMWVIHKLQKKPLVITVHNQMIDREMRNLNYLDLFCVKSLFSDKMVQLICVNNEAKLQIECRFNSIANEIKVIPAYIKPVEIGSESDYLPEALIQFIDTHPRYIVYYAESFAYNNGTEIYGTEECIDAFVKVSKQFPDLSLVFCMPNVNDYNRLVQLQYKLAQNNLGENVYWQLGPLNEMWPLMKRCTLYLRTTSTDGDSVLLREALGLKVPSLASDVVNRPEECETYQFGNQNDLINKISRMLVSPKCPTSSTQDFFNEMLEVYMSIIEKYTNKC